MGGKTRRLLVIVLMIAGIVVMIYPALSNYINTIHSSRAVQELSRRLENTDPGALEQQRALAEQYNEALWGGAEQDKSGDILTQYDRILDFGNGVMGSISIPKIGVELSVYHGVSDTVLQKGVGHVPKSAFPIGGAGNHCVLTGHTGLPSAELFSDLTKLTEGDVFYLQVLGQTLGYAVDRITVVLPHETQQLGPVPDRDCCTLVTCTPYGINSHRLLVRGQRIRTDPTEAALVESVHGEAEVPIPLELILAGGAVAVLLTAALAVLLRREPGEEGAP